MLVEREWIGSPMLLQQADWELGIRTGALTDRRSCWSLSNSTTRRDSGVSGNLMIVLCRVDEGVDISNGSNWIKRWDERSVLKREGGSDRIGGRLLKFDCKNDIK